MVTELNPVHPGKGSGNGISCLFSSGCLRRSPTLLLPEDNLFLKDCLAETLILAPLAEEDLEIDCQAT